MKSRTLVGDTYEISQPEYELEVQIRADGAVMWVNIDGLCVLRVSQIERGRRITISRQATDLGEGASAYADGVIFK